MCAWLTGWIKRKPVVITGSADGALSDFQVKVVVSYDEDMANDFSDLRFTDSDEETELPYWIEDKTDGVSADVWVKVPSIPASPDTVTIYMYYDGTESSVSDGDITFIQYTESETSTYLKSLVTALSSDLYYRTRFKNSGTPSNVLFGIGNNIGGSDDYLSIQSYTSTDLRYVNARNDGTQSATSEAPHFSDNTYYIGELKFLSGESLHGFIDDNEIGAGVNTNLPDESMGLWLWVVSGSLVQDWAFVAKYTANEPTYEIGSEEKLSQCGHLTVIPFHIPAAQRWQ